MSSLSILVHQLSFPETCTYIKKTNHTNAVRNFVQHAVEQRWPHATDIQLTNISKKSITNSASKVQPVVFVDQENQGGQESQEWRIIFVLNACDHSLIAFDTEDDFWLISIMFDRFPYHTIDLTQGTIVVYPSEMQATLSGTLDFLEMSLKMRV